jgi:hypothetical protein
MPLNKPNVDKGTEYTFTVQLISFCLFWALPSFWAHYLIGKVFNIDAHGILLWVGFVVLNLATYANSRALSTNVNGYLLQALIFLQIFAWILR